MNYNQPKVSIIMGIYNCENTLSDYIESILNQTYDNWELIMCDDCSNDNTVNTRVIHWHTLSWVSWKVKIVKFIRLKIFIPIF